MDGERVAARMRPANRRELILAAATGLIAEHGYESVSMGDIATAVGVGPSALYRHFPGKDAVLAESVRRYVDGLVSAARGDGAGVEQPPADRLAAVAEFVIEHRRAGLLWAREARHLPVDVYESLSGELLDEFERLAATMTGARGGQRTPARAMVGVAMSISFHHVELPRPAFVSALAELLRRAGSGPVTTVPASRTTVVGLRRSAKREQILTVAVRLFAQRTYDAVGVEDIAAAAELAPSSVYNHYSGKAEILATALFRGNGYIQVEMDNVLARSADAQGALAGIVASYADFAGRHPDLVHLIVTETRGLPPAETQILRGAQRGYIEEWVSLYRAVEPTADVALARLTVQAAIMSVNDLARTPVVGGRHDGVGTLAVYGQRILGIGEAGNV